MFTAPIKRSLRLILAVVALIVIVVALVLLAFKKAALPPAALSPVYGRFSFQGGGALLSFWFTCRLTGWPFYGAVKHSIRPACLGTGEEKGRLAQLIGLTP